MNVSFWPKTKMGKWSLGFFVVAIVSFTIFILLISIFDQRGGETFFSNLYLAIPIIMFIILGCLTFLTGIIAIIKYNARSISVFISTLLGLIIILFYGAELLFPH